MQTSLFLYSKKKIFLREKVGEDKGVSEARGRGRGDFLVQPPTAALFGSPSPPLVFSFCKKKKFAEIACIAKDFMIMYVYTQYTYTIHINIHNEREWYMCLQK
jgi:hypothetical protein